MVETAKKKEKKLDTAGTIKKMLDDAESVIGELQEYVNDMDNLMMKDKAEV